MLNTTLGALSNISLLDSNRKSFLRLGICNLIKTFLKNFVQKNKKSKEISTHDKSSLTSCLGLVANLAINSSDKFVKEDK